MHTAVRESAMHGRRMYFRPYEHRPISQKIRATSGDGRKARRQILDSTQVSQKRLEQVPLSRHVQRLQQKLAHRRHQNHRKRIFQGSYRRVEHQGWFRQ